MTSGADGRSDLALPCDLGPAVAAGRWSCVHRGRLAGRSVAVKVARPHSPDSASVLRREARVLSSACHPGLVPIVGFREDAEAPALVLPWAEAGTLVDLARLSAGSKSLVCPLGVVAGALDALHDAGELHLDVTPANILIGPSGPWLSDPAPPGAGTAGWVDPHVLAGGPASARSDVFALAVTTVLVLTGLMPAPGDAVEAPVGAAGNRALRAALSPEPGVRPGTPTELVDALEWVPGPGLAEADGRLPTCRPPPRTWPLRGPPGHESIRDATGSTHDLARVFGWRRTRRGG